MATMVLTVAGGLVGGPMGAAIGATLGNAVDHAIFRPKGREGLRLSDLKVQTSSYGTQIPKLFGTMRIAGSVIWATDLIEHRNRESNGKGQASTTTYSYTASLAVALSARPILGVGRIWADGQLLRGAAGDFKARTGFRLYLGSEDQAADPLIVAAEGAGLAPAHRGIAYAVFEDLELGPWGNRIPSLTFEVQADAGPVAAGEIATALGAVAASDPSVALAGFAAQGSSLATVAEALASAAGGWFGEGSALHCGTGDAVMVEDAGAGGGGRGNRSLAAATSAPRTLTLSHYDPARDYQIGVQRAGRAGTGLRETRIELPAAIDAGTARTLAEAALLRADTERERRSVRLGWEALAVPPGARVRIAGTPGLWRVDGWKFEAMAVTLDCVALAPETAAIGASSGRVLAAPDTAIGRTLVHAFELPPIDDAALAVPRLAVAAGGSAAGWRRAALLLSTDGGSEWQAIGGTRGIAVLGTVIVPPGPALARVEDRRNSVDVVLGHDGMQLDDADVSALDRGANLAMLGDELIQFAHAQSLGAGHWRLSGLWRGRRGTEHAIGTQAPGDRFVMLDTDTLALVDLPSSALGGQASVLAEGAGDAGEPAAAEAGLDGISLLPLAPVHFAAHRLADGSVQLRWTRRSRSDWRWQDGGDVTPEPGGERYRLSVTPETGPAWSVDLLAPEVTLSAALCAQSLGVELRQIGTAGLSRAATLTLPISGETP
ncbi:phage tail protein [Sphingomonas sp. HITSZ_GF]|uniref:phage tail protein n=1 Tax=Sphingomonas sp. HITSZ_GF TaxID=3037247 RepID=UPI00240E617B|nr:phage tail protein [Sphingomonas sp. HITSZ_GF]MDG2534471.1 phage tail protein [Sphingomonas sp. HITSZ_GF]